MTTSTIIKKMDVERVVSWRVFSRIAALTLLSCISLPAIAGPADSSTTNVVLGTLQNFNQYYVESLQDIVAQGGEGATSMPQTAYEPGLGPVNVLPEFSSDLGLAFGPLYLLDLPTIPFELRPITPSPEVPAINRKVVGITEKEGFTDPHIPPLRWSADGRLGVESQVGGSLQNPSPVRLYLFAPEKLNKPFVDSPSGPSALVMDKVELPFSQLAPGRTGSIQHANICDPYLRAEGDRRNPYSCGAGGEDDCYDVTLISGYIRLSNVASGNNIPAKLDNWDRVMGTPLHIRVSNPKTTEARIAEVVYGESKFSPKRTGVLFETLTPADGRLFVARRGFLPLVWPNQDTGKTHFGSYDVVYAVSPPEAEPCDVTYWSDLYPITHAPYDKRVNTRYAFAMQPFRDPSGAVIPDGVDLKGTYPWMDKEAKNFSVQVSGAKLFPSYNYDKNRQSRYPVRCVSESECSIDSIKDVDNSKDNMFVLMGAWTQGKMVLLDGMLNDVDFRLGGMDRNHSYLSLYKPGTGHNPNDTGEVRVGSTRGETIPFPVRNDEGELIGRYKPENMSMLDSIENRLNFLPNMRHSRFQDVVWNMSSGHSTVEFSFDDYLHPDGFIVSDMVAHLQHKSSNWYRMLHFDGWHQMSRMFNGQVRVQNAATALPDRWKIPAYGRVYNGRLEPVANGGITGKGMWFNGNTRISYSVPEQPQSIYANDWFYSLFIDPRFADDDQERVLIAFPDNSQMTIKGRRQVLLYNHQGRLVAETALPDTLPEKGWSHLALVVNKEEEGIAERRLTLYLNGFHLRSWIASVQTIDIERSNFRPAPGALRLGGGVSTGGKRAFKGWMDEFKVFAYRPNPEVICNFGHGTLMGVPENYDGDWKPVAERYAGNSHASITRFLSAYGQQTFPQYVCYHDYSDDNKAHHFNLPAGLTALREAINFPEGPLYFDAPRPDSTSNEFCLSCHHAGGVAGLDVDALSLNPQLQAKEDPRRQPTQPPAKVYGNVPANWFTGAPASSFITGDMGAYLDEWVLPSSENVGPTLHNVALATDSGRPWKALAEGDLIDETTLPPQVTQLRANANGLVRSVVFDINGYRYQDDAVPFTVDREFLVNGLNEITVTATDGAGNHTALSLSVNVGTQQHNNAHGDRK